LGKKKKGKKKRGKFKAATDRVKHVKQNSWATADGQSQYKQNFLYIELKHLEMKLKRK
jgi:hypothetical protein